MSKDDLPEKSKRDRWVLVGLGCLLWSLLAFGILLQLVLPGELPPQVKQQVSEKPWVFVLFLLIGFGFAAFGSSAVVHGVAYNLTDAAFAKDEYHGRSARLIGVCQCIAGSTAIGCCTALLVLA